MIMRFSIGVFVLSPFALISSVLGLQVNDRALGIADIPSCGVC